MLPRRYSLAALFVVLTVVAILLAYLRSLHRDVVELGGTGVQFGSGAFTEDQATRAFDSVKALLRREGYASSKAPSLPRVHGNWESHDWFVRRVGSSGEVYVVVSHGPEEVNAHSLRIRSFVAKSKGPFANPGPTEAEDRRITSVLGRWWQAEIESGKVISEK